MEALAKHLAEMPMSAPAKLVLQVTTNEIELVFPNLSSYLYLNTLGNGIWFYDKMR